MASDMWKIVCVLLSSFAYLTAGDICENPQVHATVYTTQDATVLTSIAFVAEFTLQCANRVKDCTLFADVKNKILPTVWLLDGSKYQVSWVEEVSKAVNGDHSIHLYDDEGYAALRKAQRSGFDTASVKPLVTIIVNHPGSYQGPWVNSEFMATVLAALVWYMAYSAKSRLLS